MNRDIAGAQMFEGFSSIEVTFWRFHSVTDQNEMAELRRAELLRTEISAEMALELRTSVASIREWAEQIGMTENRQGVQRLASDVAAEAERLEITVGSFLAGRENARAAQA